MRSVRHRHDDALSRITWGAFEHLVAEHFRRQGYRVEHERTGGIGHTDSGIDLKLYRDQEVIAVQCKHWNSFQVPHHDVHQLIRAMHTAGATGAIAITSGEFTVEAIDAAAKFRHVRLIDGRTVRAMLGPTQRPLPERASHADRWVPIGGRREPEKHATHRAAALAAVAAVIVMGVALVTLYTVYIHEIQSAQMAALRHAPEADGPQRPLPNVTSAAVPGFLASPRSTSPPSTEGNVPRPAVIHGAPAERKLVADWNDKPPIQAVIKDP